MEAKQWLNYSTMVNELVKSPQLILQDIQLADINLWHAATGISTEAGEFLDATKKAVIYNQAWNKENMIEELGDIEFYLEQARQTLGVTREEIINANMRKLGIRYSKGYSDRAAKERADKQGDQK